MFPKTFTLPVMSGGWREGGYMGKDYNRRARTAASHQSCRGRVMR